MCDRNSVLIIFLIFKIIILVVLPIVLYILYRLKNKLYDVVGIITALFILVLIILRLASNECVTNSTISYLRNNDDIKVVEENTNPATIYESIYPTETYLTDDSENVYFYDINSEGIKNNKISCDKESYLKNYGDSISAITSLISNRYYTDIDMVEVITYLEEANLIDCDNGIDFDAALKVLSEPYNYNVSQITRDSIKNYLSDGKSVLVETSNKANETNNFGCEKDYIVIYNVNNDDEYSIINPNDKGYSYFCPSNTIGYGSIIEGEQNSKPFTLNEIDSKALRYFVIEVTE